MLGALVIAFFPLTGTLEKDARLSTIGVVHGGGICWDPDIEFPVPCDADDD